MTLWHPDTCTCQIEIDDAATRALPPGAGTIVGRQVQGCALHADHLATHAHNTLKNRAVSDAADALGVPADSVRWSVALDDGSITIHAHDAATPEQRQSMTKALAKHGALVKAA